MKIGILTYFGDLNPGTNLQAYSLFKNITEIYNEKASVEIINYHSFKRVNRPFLSSVSISSLYRDIVRINKYKKFQRKLFSYSDIHLTTNDYEKAKDYILKQKYDIIYIGSDTLLELNYADSTGVTIFWLPSEIKAKKIMIAASARNTEYDSLSEMQKEKMKDSILNIDFISVRDDATKRLISSLSGFETITKIPDPTFALEVDHSYAQKYINKKGIKQTEKIICIHLTRQFKWGKEFSRLAREHGYKIVSLRPCYYADYVFNDLSPLEYSGIFKFFAGVITHRYHDTVFSLKNLTPVITAIPNAAYSNQYGESKHSSLLKDFDLLESNFIDEPLNVTAAEVYNKISAAINSNDNNKINKKLLEKKNEFLNFLMKSL